MKRSVLNFGLAFVGGCVLAGALQVRSAWAWTRCDPPSHGWDYVEVRRIQGTGDVAVQAGWWPAYVGVSLDSPPRLFVWGDPPEPSFSYELQEEEP